MDAPKTIYDLTVGQVFEHKRLVSKNLIREFAVTTGYLNPIHLDEARLPGKPFLRSWWHKGR